MTEEAFEIQERHRLEAEQHVAEAKKPRPLLPEPNIEALLVKKTVESGKGTLVLTDVNVLNDVLKETMAFYNVEIGKVTEKLRLMEDDAQRNYRTVVEYVDAINQSNQSIITLFNKILLAVENSHPNNALEKQVLDKINKEL